MELSVLILAAGQGTRMRSSTPKVLHKLAGKALLQHVIDSAKQLNPQSLHVVYGHGGERVRDGFVDEVIQWVEQAEQLGTGHAVAQALPGIPDKHHVLVLYGDVPLIQPETLQALCNKEHQGINLLTVYLDNPSGYGRIVRDIQGQGEVMCIVEEKDADTVIRQIHEVNTGILLAPAAQLRRWLRDLSNDNAQGEYYLTDIIGMAANEKLPLETFSPSRKQEVMGVNNRVQLAELERCYQLNQAERLMLSGVSLADPARLDIRGEISNGQDISIDINVVLEGSVKLGNNVKIGPHCLIRNAEIGDNTEIFANSVIDDAMIGGNCRIGPFARIRPQTRLADQVHIGNFVEVKKSQVAQGSKINHLSYIGDTEIGCRVNIGAGTITCNYDGVNKHKTIIGDNAFIGSDTQLVAPVIIGAGATVGAGSTITQDALPDKLTLSRSAQKTVDNWKRPAKK